MDEDEVFLDYSQDDNDISEDLDIDEDEENKPTFDDIYYDERYKEHLRKEKEKLKWWKD